MSPARTLVIAALMFGSMATRGQDAPTSRSQEQSMQGMPMNQKSASDMDRMMAPETFIDEILQHAGSGTSAEPNSMPIPMVMTMTHEWMLMFHGNIFILDEQQTSKRGHDKFFSTNWFMGMAQRTFGPGTFTVRSMLSLEPATVSDRRYPLLFQQGETAFGKPIADGQHPHDFFMEIAFLYDMKLGEKSLLSFYFAPVGDPAIGPTAYPHRGSASENPVGALGHHQEDSTHISNEVVTMGVTRGILRVEASGFHGREPDEYRWDMDSGKIDSWSTRVTLQPGQNWSGQYSYARIASPEALFPGEDQARMTASAMYNRPIGKGNWSNTILWGRTRSLRDSSIFNSYLFESTVGFHTLNHIWTRIENTDRSNELVLGESSLPQGIQEEQVGRVQGYTIGYGRDFDLMPHVASALGAQITVYGVPATLQSVYGNHPLGIAVFARFRPFSGNVR